MAANLYTTGAIEHFVTVAGTTYYLGTATTAPEIENRPAFLNVINDLGGRTVPFQKVPDRSQHIITTTLNRFDWAVYKRICMDQINAAGIVRDESITTHGILALGSATTLSNGLADFELTLVYTLAGTPVAPVDLPPGRRYWSCVVLGSKESTVGTRVEEVSLVLEANQLFDPVTRSFVLYSEVPGEVLTGLPAVT
jgi:hypothetical protein